MTIPPDGLSLDRTVERRGSIPTRFMSDNETEAEAAWTSIEAGHGLVAVNPLWAAARSLPATIVHPRDPTKVVYIIEAYHTMHCLVSLLSPYPTTSQAPKILTAAETPPRAFHGHKSRFIHKLVHRTRSALLRRYPAAHNVPSR